MARVEVVAGAERRLAPGDLGRQRFHPAAIASAEDGGGSFAAPEIEIEFAGKARSRIPASISAGWRRP